MRKKNCAPIVLRLLASACLLSGVPGGAIDLAAETRSVVLGTEHGWRDVATSEHVSFVDGKRGYPDAVLRDKGYQVTDDTDLLVDFDDGIADRAGHYTLLSGSVERRESAARRGAAGGVFSGSSDGVVFVPGVDALLASNRSWRDITIEFRLYPALLEEGATVLEWDGSYSTETDTTFKHIRVVFEERRLTWSFDNVFTPPDLGSFRLTLSGDRTLIPKRWHHHLFRFQGDTGRAEYLIDGETVAITHATRSGREEREIFHPHTGNRGENSLSVGAGFTGFIDEVRIQRSFVDMPSLERFPTRGAFTTRIFDLAFSGSRLRAVDADYREPGTTAALFYFRIGETLADASSVAGPWTPCVPGRELGEEHVGRYVQLRAELLPDGARERSPVIHSLELIYEPDLPPHPPERVRATAGNREITVTWNRSLDADVAGYLVYYGDASMRYFGEESDQGASPVDAGDADMLTLTGLRNGTLYHISVVAYDDGEPPHQSEFAPEVTARPRRVLGSE